MTSAIIIGYDGSQTAQHALQWAADEAIARDAPLRILSCYQPPVTTARHVRAAGEMPDGPETEARRVAESARSELAVTHPSLHVTTEVRGGPAAQILTSGRGPDDLVVVGAGSRRGLGAFLGSTARAAVHAGACPVVVVRHALPDVRVRRIVVGVDGSRSSDAALRWAARESELHEVELMVVHSWLYPYAAGIAGGRDWDVAAVGAANVRDASVGVARELTPMNVSGQTVECTPVIGLVERTRPGDLLVVGSRGHGAVKSALFGSTVHGLLERSDVPVVVVPPPSGRRSRV